MSCPLLGLSKVSGRRESRGRSAHSKRALAEGAELAHERAGALRAAARIVQLRRSRHLHT